MIGIADSAEEALTTVSKCYDSHMASVPDQ
jgi:hypothetical protein